MKSEKRNASVFRVIFEPAVVVKKCFGRGLEDPLARPAGGKGYYRGEIF
jgi:hypothetical protein